MMIIRRFAPQIGRFSCAMSCLLCLGGCTSGAGGGFGLFPTPRHKINEQAEQLKMAQAAPVALPRELNKQFSAPYIVEPGDVLLIQPADLDSPVRLPGDQPILPDGTIQLGKYGRLLVGGKTIDEIEAAVKAHIAIQTKDVGAIAVRVVTRASKVFYVLGEVNSPGSFTLTGRETVLDAVLAAGGLTDRAAHDQILLSRPTEPCSCRVVLPICWDEIVQIGDTATNYQIAAGDRVFVPSKGNFDNLCNKKKACPPCGAPQSACILPPVKCCVEPRLPQ